MHKGFSRASVRAILAASTLGITASAWGVPQTAPFLSVDLNGGQLYIDVEGLGRAGQDPAVNLGWNGTANVPVLSPVLGTSFLWQPWGGHDGILVPANPILQTPAINNGGDGIQLPHDLPLGGYPTGNTPITKGFAAPTGAVSSGTVTVSISAGSGISLSSRDRNIGTGDLEASQLPDDGVTNYANMYRDFVYVVRNSDQGLGSNPVVIQLSGLNPNTTYEFTGFAFDPFSPGQHHFGGVPTQQFGYNDDTIPTTTPDNFRDLPPILRDSLLGAPSTWNRNPENLPRSIAPENEYTNSSSFQVTSDANGNVTFYEWANSYHDGGQSQTVFNGFQVGTVAASRWNATSSANWGTGPWIGGQPNAIGAVANLGQVSAPQTVTLEAGKTVAVLTIASSNAYTIAGSALTFDGISSTYTALEGVPPPEPVVKTFNGHAQLNVQGNHSISAPLVLNDNTFVRVAGGSSLTVSSGISGDGALNKTGDGVLTLTGTSTNSNGVTVFQGRLHLEGTHSGGTFSVVGGGQLTGTGTVSALTSLWNNGVISPGPELATLTFSTLAFGSQNVTTGNVTLNIDLAAGNASDKLVVTSGLEFSVNPDTQASWDGSVLLNFNNTGAGAGSTFTLIDYSGPELADVENFVPATPLLGDLQPQIINDTANTRVDMQLVVPNAWNIDNNGNASVGENYTGNVAPNGVGQVVKFGDIITDGRTVTIDAPTTLGGIAFSSPNTYTLGGTNPITMDVVAGQAVINVTAGNHTIAAPVVLADNLVLGGTSTNSTLVISGAITPDPNLPTGTTVGITKTGAGTASLTGVNTYTGNTVVQGGALKLNTPARGVVFTGAGAVVNGGRLVLDYDNAGNNPAAQVLAALDAGYDQPTKFSTGALRTTNFTGGSQGLGWIDNVANTEVVIAYTYYGDADLNGQVDVADLGILASNWQTAGDWGNADFDYSGFIDVNDLGLLASNWQAGVGNPLGPSLAEALASVGFGTVAVPEPASIGLLGVLVSWSLKRSGRRC